MVVLSCAAAALLLLALLARAHVAMVREAGERSLAALETESRFWMDSFSLARA